MSRPRIFTFPRFYYLEAPLLMERFDQFLYILLCYFPYFAPVLSRSLIFSCSIPSRPLGRCTTYVSPCCTQSTLGLLAATFKFLCFYFFFSAAYSYPHLVSVLRSFNLTNCFLFADTPICRRPTCFL